MMNLLEKINERLHSALPKRVIASLLVAAECFSVVAVGVPTTYAQEDEGIVVVDGSDAYAPDWDADAGGELELLPGQEEAVTPAEAAELGANAAEQAAYEAELAAYDAAMAAYDAEVSAEDYAVAAEAAARTDEAVQRAREAADRAADEAAWALDAYHLAEQEAQEAAEAASRAFYASDFAAQALENALREKENRDSEQSGKKTDAGTDDKNGDKTLKTPEGTALPERTAKPGLSPDKEPSDRSLKSDGDKSGKPANKSEDASDEKTRAEAEQAELDRLTEQSEILAAEASEKAASAAHADEEAQRAWEAADRAAAAANRAAAAVDSACEASARAWAAVERAAAYEAERDAAAQSVEKPENTEPGEGESPDASGADGELTYRELNYADAAVTVTGEAPEGVEVRTEDVSGAYGDFDPDAFSGAGVSDMETFASDESEYLRSEDPSYTVLAAYDIALSLNGEDYQPEDGRPLAVSITLPEIPKGTELRLWHIRGDGRLEQIRDFTLEGNTLSFEAAGFSVYVVTQVTITTHITAGDGNTYRVSVTYDQDAAMPEDAVLAVRELGDDEKESYVNQSAEALGTAAEDFAFARAFDIAILDPDTGAELRPASGVKVSISLLDTDLSAAESLNLLHFGEEVEKVDYTLSGGAVAFETDGFSVYVLCGYTVDFHWGDYTYSIAGESDVTLSALFEKLGVTEITVADVADVSFSDETLVKVETVKDDAEQIVDWRLTSLTPFDTDEALTLTLKNGETVKILVTDEPEEDTRIQLTITADSDSKLYDGTELKKESYTVTGGLAEGDSIESVSVTGSQTEVGSSENVAREAKIVDAEGEDVTENYAITYIAGTLEVKERKITITADSAEKTYDGEELTANGWTSTELARGDSITSVDITGSRTDAGVSTNTAINAVIVDSEGQEVTRSYEIIYEDGSLTVNPKGVTLTANSATRKHTGEVWSVSGYTSSEGELEFEGVQAVASGTDIGIYDVTFSGVTVNETRDSTGNYVVTAVVNGLLFIVNSELNEPSLLKKEITGFNGDLASYKIEVNPEGLVLTGSGDRLVLKDTFSGNQSINYGSIEVTVTSGEEVTYDYSGNTGTYSIPDGTAVTITYVTRVKGDAGDLVRFSNTAVLGRMEGWTFVGGPTASAEEEDVISPTGSDISGTGGVFTIDLFVYAENHMEEGLGGATFRLLDNNMQPMTYLAGKKAGQQITFTTGSDGYVAITLSEENDGLSIHKNTAYYLEMVTAPYQLKNGEYIYYQKDNTFYSFLITDDPNYTYGGIYAYFNGDVLKVRCYPESAGVNVTQRFSGSYSLTDEQKNNIKYILQKEALDTESGWVDVETHYYREFSYGSMNFKIGKSGGTELEDNATYRIIMENALPEELAGIVEENVTVSVTYQAHGRPVEEDSNEFWIDPDDKLLAHSYNLAFTNEYIDHKLSIVKIDEESGKTLPGAVFTIYPAEGGEALGSYTADADGLLTIRKNDEGMAYETDTLYYAVETVAPTGYILPKNPRKVYFYFSEKSSAVPDGLPAGAKATDLTTAYTTDPVPNNSNAVDVPVTVVWGVKGNEAWPANVKSVEVGLYKSVDRGDPVRVTDKQGRPRTVTLTAQKYYNVSSFSNLPALEDGKTVVYSVREEHVRDYSDNDLISSFAYKSSISGTGWYVVNNQPAVSVTVEKQWYELDGTTPVADTSEKPAVSFSLYRTKAENSAAALTRSELSAFLAGAECVRSGIKLSYANTWTVTEDSLEKTDADGNAYYYFALESIPENQEDSYVIASATELQPRRLTIRNKQTPITVTIQALDLEKTYGDPDPYANPDPETVFFTASVMEDGSKVVVNSPDEAGNCTATVTSLNNTVSTIHFKVAREEGEKVGDYAITLTGDAFQEGYRVLFGSATMTIKKAKVTITAGAEKQYGMDDPEYVTIDGLKNNEDASVLVFEVSREIGEDVGEYPITLTGETDQGNYTVNYVLRDEEGNPYTFRITRARATITPDDKTKTYGEEDPDFSVTVTGVIKGDDPSGFIFDLTRQPGEDVGKYIIRPEGDLVQGNYDITYKTGTLTILVAPLTVTVEPAEKTYGDEDPEWEVMLDGLQGSDEDGEISSELDAATGVRTYRYAVSEGETARTLVTFTTLRAQGENIGDYVVTPSGLATQGNYEITFEHGTLTIIRAELNVTPKSQVKAVAADDPLLEADIEGWKNGDEICVATHTNSETAEDGYTPKITWTYTLGEGDDAVTILSFTLKRVKGEEEGDVYDVFAEGAEEQSNYKVIYDPGTFSILSVLDIDVTQILTDYADPDANPEYSYTATLDLAGTGLNEYEKNGFESVEGVPTLSFTLPEDKANMKTLKVPGGAKLTITQNTANDDYITLITVDGSLYTNSASVYTLGHVDTYHNIAFRHNRINMPVEARAAVGQTETGAQVLTGRKGALGIPRSGDGLPSEEGRSVDSGFADEMYSKIGYELPSDKYYVYDHASLYYASESTQGSPVASASNIVAVRYALVEPTTAPEGGTESAPAVYKWQYSLDGSSFANAPDDTKLVLFYLPKYVCKINEKKYYTLNEAVKDVANNVQSGPIEMLIPDYAVRSAADAAVIPAGCEVTVKTASTEYEGEPGTNASISRSLSYTTVPLFTNRGTLTLENITVDGKGIDANAALIRNEANAVLTVGENAVLANAKGVDGGAIYAAGGTVTVSGSMTDNSASNGGAIYAAGGTVNVNGSLTDSRAVNGGAIYTAGGIVNIAGTVSGSTATSGGAVYLSSGTVTVSGSLTDNEAANGAAVYQTGGTLTVSGSMSENSASADGGAIYLTGGTATVADGGSLSENEAASNGGAVYQSGGTLNNQGTVSGNSAQNGGGFYRVGGTFMAGGTVSANTAGDNGGGIYSVGNPLEVTASVSGNSAQNGGAVYMSGSTLKLTGCTLSGNSASTDGGAVYALNAATTFGSAAQVSGNTASGNGGALYMEGGSANVRDESELKENTASNGGAIYATSGTIALGSVETVKNGDTSTTTTTGCKLTNNEAAASGGAIYTLGASVEVKAGSVTGNRANLGNGGAIYSESDTVTVSGGTLSGNSADRGVSTDSNLGLGGAIYAGSGTVNYSGGNINGGNTALNGAAIFTGTGIANISASITGNTASEGGAVGVGSTDARLYFTGNANVYDNKLGNNQRNVCLDVDSDLVINALTLSSGKKIGVYVPGDVNSEQVVKHGDVTAYFGAYTETNNLASTFKNDRFSDLKVGFEHNQLYWVNELKYDVYYLSGYSGQFPPTSNYQQTPSKKVCTGKSYVPRTRESDIYDLVMAMKLYEAHNNDFTNNVGANYASMAVYAYTFSDKAMNSFANYLQRIEWDGEARKWKFIEQDGTEAPADTTKLVIFYSSPAYLTVVNNNTDSLTLDISEISILGKNAADGLYGFVTAKNGATIQTLRTITADDLKLEAGESIKLMFPGAQGQSIAIMGTLNGEGATYTFKGGNTQTVAGHAFTLNGSLNNSDTAAELIFGEALPICKIGDEPFSTLKLAMDYAKAQKTATGNNTYKIEMLVDYLVPKDDVLDIPEGYNITFTTASPTATTLPYTGNGTRATLSRDTGNSGASVKANKSTLTVDNLAFDGRSLTAGGAGGAINTNNCTTVTLSHCEFRGYRADQGGAVYVNNTNDGSSLTVKNCKFTNCQTNASVDKAGGGGIWTTARKLDVRDCQFEDCACLKGSAQAGAVFHNILAGQFTNSKTWISGCSFENCFSAQASGGTVESDAKDITILNCSFNGSYSSKPSGSNGGALNVYAENTANTSKDCVLRVVGCTFEDCNAKLGTANGGAIRTTTKRLLLWGCTFKNTQSVTGGAVSMTNTGSSKLEIYSCTFDKCVATGNGGAVSASVVPVVIIGDAPQADTDLGDIDSTKVDLHGVKHTAFIDCTANRGGGIDNAKNDTTVTMENVSFTRCAARTSGGGALYTQAKTLSVTGTSNIFTGCTGYGSGGAVYQNRTVENSIVTLNNCTFTDCETFNGGNGGGMYANARTLRINYDKEHESAIENAKGSFKNCTAANAGGGLYHDYTGTLTVANCGFENCTAKAAYGGGLYTTANALTIIGKDSKFKDCTAQTDGGGLYQNRNVAGSVFSFKEGSFENCTATGSYGGAIYTFAKTVTLENATVTNSKAKAQGGGVWTNASSANFSVCTFTDCSVTNTDSRGGGVYIGGGTTICKDSTVSGCSAAYGGGWYQNEGILYILGGSVSGSAVNGGGLYENKGTVNHYGGTVAGTATSNGGGVYKNDGAYTIGNGSYDGAVYSDAAIGAVTMTESGSSVYTATAVNGGGIYQNAGSLTVNAGGSISGQASGNGGGIYVAGGELKIYGGLVTNCQATGNGGGVYFISNHDFCFYGNNDAKIQNCRAANGGGVYMNSAKVFHLGEKDKTSLGIIENCHATVNGGGLYQANGTVNLRNTSIIRDCSADVNGGGVYHMDGTFNIYGEGRIEHCTAKANGGGMYNAGGTFTFEGGSIIRNEATENGGGVYQMGGTFNMTSKGAVIGGSETNANTANVGAGVFVADGQSATFNDNNYKKLEISYNHALTAGGGIAVGGPAAKLTFSNVVKVQNNTMGTNNSVCNVYLDQDSNTVINNNYLSPDASIGVYASDAQNAGHGLSGMPFATYSNESNLNSYHNDHLRYLYGVKGSNNLVVWANFVCKITDGDGKLLYKDADGTPAAYAELENRANGADNNAGAFTVLNVSGTPNLYQLNEDGSYTPYNESGEGEYQVQMLVPNYEMGATRQIKLNTAAARKVTLTTASTTEDECGFKYTGDARFAATITRTVDTYCMIYVGDQNGWDFTLRNITLDGGNKKASEDGSILRINNGSVKVTLDSGATLQNGSTDNKAGGAVYLSNNNATFTMNAGSQIKDCSAGTANGGGVAISNGIFTMNGGTISGCTAANGGGVHVDNSGKIEMNGGTITGNNATSNGGGISLNNYNSRIFFSGLCNVTGNTLNGTTRCNVQLNQDSNVIINVDGIEARSEIGIYVPDGPNAYDKHGGENDPFGTRMQEEDNYYCFVNDRHTYLRGFRAEKENETRIFWEYHPLLQVTKEVDSDWSGDKDKLFRFRVTLDLDGVSLPPKKYGDMTFNRNGVATFSLKAGQSATASLPDSLHLHGYTVEEYFETSSNDAKNEDYTITATRRGEAYLFAEETPLTVTGKLGEFVGNTSEDESTVTESGEINNSLSDIVYTNTRVTGAVMFTKKVTSSQESDKDATFNFVLTLGGRNDTKINKAYEAVRGRLDEDGKVIVSDATPTELTVTNGEARFTLKDGETLTIRDLPTGMPFTLKEVLDDAQEANLSVSVNQDLKGEYPYDSEAGVTGVIGKNYTTANEIVGAEESEKSLAARVDFNNSFLEIVCKITNRSRELLYYRDTNGRLQPAIFSHLEDAFDQINSGNIRTATNGIVSSAMRIEMVVPAYTMERQATLISGKTVTLSTAFTTDAQYPYKREEGEPEISTVSRGFDGGSMIVDNGALTLDRITLDGGSQEKTAEGDSLYSVSEDGGILRVNNNVRLTVNPAATLLNSATDGNGGAIWLTVGASLTMNGSIDNCSAAYGGGIYAADRFTTLAASGRISNCEAVTGDGGAIFAGTGTSVNLNAEAVLVGNRAANNGGAVCSGANVILRGTIGGTATEDSNIAGNEGGGIYIGNDATYTMYAGSAITGNRAKNGGALAAGYTTRIAGGSMTGNIAAEKGGAVYAAESAVVTISGASDFIDNRAMQGGAVYNQGTASMSGGSMTGNIADLKGGAVYVADTGTDGATGHSFTMSGGSITGNKSPEGAVSADANSWLVFSGNAKVSDNTGSDGTTRMNVFLAHDSNSVIRTPNLGANASIGVYVADGLPETADPSSPDYREDRVDNPLFCKHGLPAREFATYIGTNIRSANLNRFLNDRQRDPESTDKQLPGMSGAPIDGSNGQYTVKWKGVPLQLMVYQLTGNGAKTAAAGVSFTLTNTENDIKIWSGKSAANGLVKIPWAGEEKENGGVASFTPGVRYKLEQEKANDKTVRPGGYWIVTVGRDNSVKWEVVASTEDNVDRIFEITSPRGPGEKAYLGDIFGQDNDIKPILTFDVNAKVGQNQEYSDKASLDGGVKTRRITVDFSETEIKHSLTITEKNPTWDSHVFRAWATMESKPTVTMETEGKTEEEIAAETMALQQAAGYYEYTSNDVIRFYRSTDSDLPSEKYAYKESKGDMTLYAQWDEVVCKITDTSGNLLYDNGLPAVYGTLEAGFEALNRSVFYTRPDTTESRYRVREQASLMIEMLVPEYTMLEPVVNNKRGTVVLTTAPSTDTDGYAYTGAPNTVCTIYRGACDTSMITNNRSLTIRSITLDGRNPVKDAYGNIESYEPVTVVCDGGIVCNLVTSAVLTIGSGATLQNSRVEGNGGAISGVPSTTISFNGGTIANCSATGSGGAIYVGANTTLTMNSGRMISSSAYYGGAICVAPNGTAIITSGEINGNTADVGAGVYLAEGSKLELSGNPNFGGTDTRGGTGADRDNILGLSGNFRTGEALTNATNGGKPYTKARQDIYIAGYEAGSAVSLTVTGNISSGNGTIWVWPEQLDHYDMLKQFAVFAGNGASLGDAAKETTMKAFRNARPDSESNCGGDYLTGQRGDVQNHIYWTGGFDVVFLKTDGFGKPLPGATFTLYTDEACTAEFQMTFTGSTPATDDGKRAATTSSDGTRTYKDKNGQTVTLKEGEVLLSKVAPKTYYLKETSAPNGFVLDPTVYQVTVSGTGGLEMRRKSSASAATFDTEVFKVRTRAATGTEPAEYQYRIMNTSTFERKVILRKTDGSYTALANTKFRIFRADLSEYTEGRPAGQSYYESGPSGAYFIGRLPYGRYYLLETEGRGAGKVFILTVNGPDAMKKELGKSANDSETLLVSGGNAVVFGGETSDARVTAMRNWLRDNSASS